jgi:flagellar biosynthesis protein
MEQKRVVGLSCKPEEEDAPVVVVKGAGDAADAVLNTARREDIPVIRDSALTDQLYRVPMDMPVGKELFPVMAVLLAHVLLVDRKIQERTS